MPFIELNGEQIADSELILAKLKGHFGIKEDYLTPEQKAMSRALERLFDNGVFT